MTALRAAHLFDGAGFQPATTLRIAAGRIAELAPDRAPADEALPADWILAPGFVDLQVNGGGGILLNDAPDAAAMRAIAAAHRGLGTTAILPTLISGGRAQMRQALAAAASAAADPASGVLGLHLEGPFLNPARRGIHPADSIIACTDADLALLAGAYPMPVLITLAPEMVPAGSIAALCAAGRVVFAGHSEADWETMRAAFAQGCRGATHLFNAMSQLTPRAPGLVGAVLGDARACAGIILDGQHLHPASALLALRLLGPERLFLVSDAMPTVAATTTTFRIGMEAVSLRDGRLRAADGTLGGAHLWLGAAVIQAVELGATPQAALRMATLTPAEMIGATDRGRIAPGARADLVALDGALRVRRVWVGGVEVAATQAA